MPHVPSGWRGKTAKGATANTTEKGGGPGEFTSPGLPYPRTSIAVRSPSLTMLKHMLVTKMHTPGSMAISGWV